jgi:hypothetical protein
MFAEETTTITVPSWVGRVALPHYPTMPIAAYVMLGLGLLLLLIGYFSPIKKIPSLLAATALVAYYPLACLLYWFLFRYDEEARALREPTKLESYLHHYAHILEWVILGVCAFFSLLFLVWTVVATLRKGRKRRLSAKTSEDNPFVPQPPPASAARPQPAAARPAAPRPGAAPQPPQARKVVRKPPTPPASDNPFKFT